MSRNTLECRKIPQVIAGKHRQLIFAFFVVGLRSCLVSLVIRIFNVGLVNNIGHLWRIVWSFKCLITLPFVVAVSPTIRKSVGQVIKNNQMFITPISPSFSV